MDKPVIEQMRESIPTVSDIKEGSVNTMDSINQSIDEAKTGIQQSLNDFSNKSFVDAGNDFLQSNSLLAKFAFLILVFIAFMMILKIAISILGYFLSSSKSPYLFRGTIDGKANEVISQDPKKEQSVTILKSNDRHRGIEFTWSSWLYMNDTQEPKYNPIFVKGSNVKNNENKFLSNGPGLYVKPNSDGFQDLHIIMDHVNGDSFDEIVVEKVPLKRWYHLAIRMQNMIMDVYVNGTIVKRHNMDKVPKQNYHDVMVGVDFSGKISNLRYYDRALNVFEINNIVMFGPNTSPSELTVDRSGTSGNYSYLSNKWYNSAYNA